MNDQMNNYYENTPKPRFSTAIKILIAVGIVLVVILVQFFVFSGFTFGSDRDMRFDNTGLGVSYNFDSSPVFHSNDNRLFFTASRDGVSFRPSNGVLEWNATHSFTSPIVAARGEILAIGDYRGRNVFVYNEDGLFFTVELEAGLISMSVTASGLLTAIVSYDTGFGVYVYNENINSYPGLFYWSVHEGEGMQFPTHAETSEDGRYIAIAVAHLDVFIETHLQFRYINQRDAWNTDRGLFNTQILDRQLVTNMSFMNNNRFVVGTTSNLIGFQVGPSHGFANELWREPLNNRLSHLEFFGGAHFVTITDDRIPGVDESDPVGMVRIFNSNGVETGNFNLGRRATHLRTGHNALILGTDRNFHAIDFRGSPLWSHTSIYDTRDILFLDNTDTILIAASSRADVYRRRRVRANDEN